MENEKWKRPDRLWNPMFISVFICSVAFNMSGQMSNSMLSLYAKSTGAPADQIGTLMSMFALTALIFRFIAGPAMNAYNRKNLLQMAMAFFGTAYLGFSFSPKLAEITGINVITIMKAFRLLQGIGNAFGISISMDQLGLFGGLSVFVFQLPVQVIARLQEQQRQDQNCQNQQKNTVGCSGLCFHISFSSLVSIYYITKTVYKSWRRN